MTVTQKIDIDECGVNIFVTVAAQVSDAADLEPAYFPRDARRHIRSVPLRATMRQLVSNMFNRNCDARASLRWSILWASIKNNC
jgi:hypothetical protein